MKVLVTWGSKRGGTAGIGEIVASTLRERGMEVAAASADDVSDVESYDAVIIGGAVYANRWPANVRRFVRKHTKALRQVPVWFFSSGPLDDSADHGDIPASDQVAALAERVGALEHVTFGGRLEEDAEGFPASAMAEENAGDWRNPERIQGWANELADALPTATPGEAVDHPDHSLKRLVAHGFVGWAGCTALMSVLLAIASTTAAIVVHAIAVPFVFGALAWHYFGGRGTREPLATALTWTGIVAVLDVLVVAWAIQGSFELLTSFAGLWLPLILTFGVTWGVGALMSTLPWPTDTDETSRAHAA